MDFQLFFNTYYKEIGIVFYVIIFSIVLEFIVPNHKFFDFDIEIYFKTELITLIVILLLFLSFIVFYYFKEVVSACLIF